MLRGFRICKNIVSISFWTWVMPNLVKAWKIAGILPLCLKGYEIFTFSCLSILFGPRGISGYPRHGPQTTRWFTRSLSIYIFFIVHLTRQYFHATATTWPFQNYGLLCWLLGNINSHFFHWCHFFHLFNLGQVTGCHFDRESFKLTGFVSNDIWLSQVKLAVKVTLWCELVSNVIAYSKNPKKFGKPDYRRWCYSTAPRVTCLMSGASCGVETIWTSGE